MRHTVERDGWTGGRVTSSHTHTHTSCMPGGEGRGGQGSDSEAVTLVRMEGVLLYLFSLALTACPNLLRVYFCPSLPPSAIYLTQHNEPAHARLIYKTTTVQETKGFSGFQIRWNKYQVTGGDPKERTSTPPWSRQLAAEGPGGHEYHFPCPVAHVLTRLFFIVGALSLNLSFAQWSTHL